MHNIVSLYLTMTQGETLCYMVAHGRPGPIIHYSWMGLETSRKATCTINNIPEELRSFYPSVFQVQISKPLWSQKQYSVLVTYAYYIKYVNGWYKNSICNMSYLVLCKFCLYIYMIWQCMLYMCVRHYKAVNFLQNSHKRHPMAHPIRKVWGVIGVCKPWFIYCLIYCRDVYGIVLELFWVYCIWQRRVDANTVDHWLSNR